MARKKNAKESATETTNLSVAAIVMDKALQPRLKLTADAVEEYAQAMKDGDTLPPCLVVWDGEQNWLCDGFHRVTAAKQIGLEFIECLVTEGTRAEAMWFAAAANMKHGVRRSNLDKRRAVTMAVECRPEASLRDIATHCGVSQEMVRQMRQQVDAVDDIQREAEIAVDEAIADGIVDADSSVDLQMVAAEAAVKRCDEAIASAMRAVDALMETPHGVFVAEQRLRTDLKNARTVLKQSLPHEVCPLCGGEGCNTCRNCGWVTKQQWDLIPANQRGI